MNRRAFVLAVGGVAAWPLGARAQQAGEMRRIGVLMLGDESDPDQQNRVRAFRAELAKMGWTEGRNIRINSRFAAKLARSRHLDARCCLLLSARSGSKNVSTSLPM